MSTLKVTTIQDASGGNTATINSMTPTADSLQGFRNRIINGGMQIDQRNAGASVTPTNNTYNLDRWKAYLTQASKFTVQQSSTAPTGFTNSLLATSSSAYSVLTGDYFLIAQNFEGLNVADLEWGTANAKTVTLSFWVRSSLTGTFGGVFGNNAGDRSYPFSYSISSANTWEQKTITIAGDTTGTWLKNTQPGMFIYWSLGTGSTYSGTAGAWSGSFLTSATGATSVVGTNGATFYLTGVQLEVGSVATPFERRDYGRELIMCQRYFQIVPFVGTAVDTGEMSASGHFKVTMRATPSLNSITKSEPDYTGTNNTLVRFGTGTASVGSATTNTSSNNMFLNIKCTGLVASNIYGGSTTVSAEL